MCKNLLNWLTILLVLPSCSGTHPTISVVCEESSAGNCIIKWETAPLLKGEVKVYASTSPERIAESVPVAMANISDGMLTIVPNDLSRRYYYSVVFNDKYRIKTATRNVHIEGVQNFRDLGGYQSAETKKTVRWGMLYRSAQIDTLSPEAYRKLKNLGLRTVIDLRSDEERLNHPILYDDDFNTVHIPIPAGNVEKVLRNIVRDEKINADSVYRLVEQMNRELVIDHRREFREVFDVLLQRDNYPALIHCTSGKGRTGVVCALLLTALGVDEEAVMADYRLSNNYFDITTASRYAYQLPVNSQEAITAIYTAKEDFLNAGKSEIEARYGSVPVYLQKGLGLSKDDIRRLREILLTGDKD